VPSRRCEWVGGGSPSEIAYHDEEWGVPEHDERRLFELITLEGAQAGLSWSTILNKRQGYRRAFAGLEPARVARLNRRSLQRLLLDPGIVRNRLKIQSTLTNARAFLRLQEDVGSFDEFLWSFVGGVPIQNRFRTAAEIPASTPRSEALSKELRQRGFRFVGPTICYALMQAAGLVNDHTVGCFRHAVLAGQR